MNSKLSTAEDLGVYAIHSIVCLMTGPKPLPEQVNHRM